MASKIKGQTMYLPITPYKVDGCEEEFKELSVTVNFDDRRKHFYVAVHAGWKSSWGGHGCIIMGGQDPLTASQFFVVKESPKNSQKYLDQMYANLELAKEAISFYFDKRKWLELRSLVIFVAACGYTENADKRVKADMAKENSSDNNQNNSEDEVMTNETMKVTDLIGKSISNGGNAKYTINAIEGDKVSVTFQMGDSEGKPMTMGLAQVEKLLQGGWQVQGSEECRVKSEKFATAQEDSKTEEPKAKTVTMGETKKPRGTMPKSKVTLKRKQPHTEEPKQEQPQGGRYRFSTYTRPTSDGGTKTLGRIDGLQEGDELMQRGVAEKIHASPMYDRDGERKVWWLSFGKRYVEAGRKVCQALNEGKSIEDCMAIVDAQTDENHAQSEARRQKNAERRAAREARKATTQPSDTNHQPSSGKVYTEAEVADLMRRVIAGDQEAMAIVNAMAA